MPGHQRPTYFAQHNLDALEAQVKLAVKYAEVYALGFEYAHEERGEANSQVAALDKAFDRQLRAMASARAAEAVHSGVLKLVPRRRDALNAFTRLHGQSERDRSRSPLGADAQHRR